MTFYKKSMALVACLLLVLAQAAAQAASTSERVFDNAGLFTSSQKQQLSQEIAQFQQDTGMDFVILTSDQSHGNATQETIADDFYDRYGFGLDDEHSGVLYYIDMDERWHHISTTGAMIDYLTDERIDSIINASTRYLSSGDYTAAAQTVLDKVRGYIRTGIPEGQYQYDVITGERLTARHKALTRNEILVSAVIALAVGLVFILMVRRRYQLKGSTYKYVFRDNSDMTMTDTDDTYLRTSTTQMRKPDPPRDGGSFGGGGGFGGGSGTHTGSSGTSHGGGGGRF